MNDPALVDPVRSFSSVTQAVVERLAINEPIRRNLPGEGRLRIDRQLPFLCIYRTPPNGEPSTANDKDVELRIKDAGTRELVTSEAAYLFTSGDAQFQSGVGELCLAVGATLQEHFGTFLFVEVWADDSLGSSQPGLSPMQPVFEVLAPQSECLPSTVSAFTEALEQVKLGDHSALVSSRLCTHVGPPRLPALQPVLTHGGVPGCCVLGLAVRPVYRDPDSGVLFPLVLQMLRSQLAWALRKTISKFSGYNSPTDDLHYETLGPTTLVKAARLVDQELCDVSESFDFLLQVTPINAESAWAEFQQNGYRREPVFQYRPLPYHPHLLKRRLFSIEIERIEDPTLAHLFWEKQEEIDRQITALRDIDTRHFLPSSQQLYGQPSDDLVQLAEQILSCFEQHAEDTPENKADSMGVAAIIERAREEIDHYHQQLAGFNARVEVCNEIAAGIMVSHDRLLIAESVCLSPERLEALMHHEIGTHLLTYFNGRGQPFQQLYAGLAGYDELQEGLAVLSEYLTGGLTANRLRTLAGRVLAVRSMIAGASFSETFHRLHADYGFAARQSFTTTLRVYRGGGLTKDVIYLRGLRDLLLYLAHGHDIEPLYVGKIGLQHVPYIQEMRRRGIIDAPSVLPRFLNSSAVQQRLEECRGKSVVELVKAN